jgi:hypothetical protein
LGIGDFSTASCVKFKFLELNQETVLNSVRVVSQQALALDNKTSNAIISVGSKLHYIYQRRYPKWKAGGADYIFTSSIITTN